MKIRVVFSFDTTADVRFVDSFSDRFSLTVLRPTSAGTTNPPKGSFAEVVTHGGRFAFLLKAFVWLVRHRDRYDVVLVLDNLSAALSANLASLITRRPVVLIEGRQTVAYYRAKRRGLGGPGYWLGLALVRAMVRLNHRLTSATAPCSHAIAAVSTAARNEVIPWYGADIEAFSPRLTREEARQRLGLPIGKPIALYRSRIAPEKDPRTFMRAIRTLADEGLEVLAAYVGGEYQTFIDLAEEEGIEHIAVGHVHPLDELPLWYRAADMMVQTSFVEGLGLSPLEAMACGTPVIASATGGLLETVRPGETGILVEVGNPSQVASAIRRLVEDPELAARLAANGRAMVVREYAASPTFDRWESLVRSLVSPS